jgi:tetratricopeptide (TPR) repeat protein
MGDDSMRLFRFRLLNVIAWITVWTVLYPAAFAVAQKGNDAKYEETISRAVKEFDLENWSEARALFKQAHGLNPNARTFRGMGMAAFEMRKYAQALQDLQSALANTQRALTPQQRDQVQKLIEQAQGYVGRYTVHVEPQQAAVKVDGGDLALDSNNQLALDLGDHEITASASGYVDLSRKVTVEGGEVQMLDLVMDRVAETPVVVPAPIPAAEPAPKAVSEKPAQSASTQPLKQDQKKEIPKAPPRAEEESSGPQWAYVTLAAGILSGGAAVVFWALGEQKYNQIEKKCDVGCSEKDIEKLKDNVKEFDTLTNVFIGVASGMAAATIALFIIESLGGSDSNSSDKTAMTITPTGIQLHGRF